MMRKVVWTIVVLLTLAVASMTVILHVASEMQHAYRMTPDTGL